MPAVSKSQQRFMGMVCAAKKGKMKNPSPEVAKASASMSKDDACDFARTKHKGLPNKKVSKEQLSYDSIRNINVDSNDRDGDRSHFDRSTARMTEKKNLKEFLNFFNTKKTPPTPKPVPKDTKV